MWKVPTLLDQRRADIAARKLGKRNRAKADNAPESDDLTPEERVGQCGCGRVTSVDMLTDIRNLPADMLTACAFKRAGSFVCDGCLETVFRSGRLTHDEFYGTLGAQNDPKAMALWKHVADRHPYPPNSPAFARRKDRQKRENPRITD